MKLKEFREHIPLRAMVASFPALRDVQSHSFKLSANLTAIFSW